MPQIQNNNNPEPSIQISNNEKNSQTNNIFNINKIKNTNEPIFKCEFCTKTYLSKAALRNHMFIKHSDLVASKNIKKLKAGRPRQKSDDAYSYMVNKYAKFWGIQKRKKDNNNSLINIEKIIKLVYDDLFIKYKLLLNFNDNIKTYKDHPLFKLFINNMNININNNVNNSYISYDLALKSYIDDIKEKTNEIYFIFIIKFLVLFRDCFNSSKNIRTIPNIKNGIERSTILSAEQVPELANEFFTDYLAKKNFFEYSLNLNDLTEMTELMQHLCYFLYIKNFTSLRLIFLNKNPKNFNAEKSY